MPSGPAPEVNAREDRRQIEHLVPLAIAFLLPYIDSRIVLVLGGLGLVYALYVSPRWIQVTTRPDEASRGFSKAKLYYVLTILFLLLLLRDRIYIAAGVWGIMGVGDALSNLIGRRLAWLCLPYNPQKNIAGILAFWIGGGAAAWVLMWWNLPPGMDYPSLLVAGYCLGVSLLCALAESLPALIDDNLIVTWLGWMVFFVLLDAPGSVPWAAALLPGAIGLALLVAPGDGLWPRFAGIGALLTVVILGSGLPGLGAILCLAALVVLAFAARPTKMFLLRNALDWLLVAGGVPAVISLFSIWSGGALLRTAFAAAFSAAAFGAVANPAGRKSSAAGLTAGVLIVLPLWGFAWIPATLAVAAVLAGVAGNLWRYLFNSFYGPQTPRNELVLDLYTGLVAAFAGGVSAYFILT